MTRVSRSAQAWTAEARASAVSRPPSDALTALRPTSSEAKPRSCGAGKGGGIQGRHRERRAISCMRKSTFRNRRGGGARRNQTRPWRWIRIRRWSGREKRVTAPLWLPREISVPWLLWRRGRAPKSATGTLGHRAPPPWRRGSECSDKPSPAASQRLAWRWQSSRQSSPLGSPESVPGVSCPAVGAAVGAWSSVSMLAPPSALVTGSSLVPTGSARGGRTC